MGDRANIVIRESYGDLDNKEAVFLYGHWSGYELPETLREALASGRARWSDESYLARIVFEHMVKDASDRETGFGISTRLTDNEYDLLVLFDRKVIRVPESVYRENGFEDLSAFNSISFEEYVAAKERTWDNLTEVLVATPEEAR